MKKLFLFFFAIILASMVTMSCKFAKEDDPGDTVAASVFEPVEPKNRIQRDSVHITLTEIHDSIGIYYIGDASSKTQLQLLSYPSRRDTVAYFKARHIKVKGSAQIGNIVRVGFYRLPSGDSIVNSVEQIKPKISAETTSQSK